MPSYQYRKSHCGDKTILWPSYLHNGISYVGNMTFLNYIRALVAQDVPDSKVHGAHLGPLGPRWAPCWPHEPCSLGCSPVMCGCLLDINNMWKHNRKKTIHSFPQGWTGGCLLWVDASVLGEAYMHQSTRSSLVQILACHLFDTNMSSESLMAYC